MPEANGGGRLDRIEATLDRITERMDRATERFDAMVEHHEREFKSLMTWQVIMQDEVRETSRFLRELGTRTDERINNLVSSIGELIARIPPESLR